MSHLFMVRLFKEASQRTGMEHHIIDTFISSAEFPFYLLQLLAPWGIFVVFFFQKNFIHQIKENLFLKFSVAFILFNIPLYWFSADHKARYLYMFFPFFAILLSHFYFNSSQFKKIKYGIQYLIFGII